MRTNMTAYLCAGVAAAGLMAVAGQACAAGFYLQEQSTRGTGRAYSGEVSDTGVESMWWNPASIGSMPTNGDAYIGASGILPSSKFTDAGSTAQRPTLPPLPVGGDPVQNSPLSNGVLPSGGVAYKLGGQFAVGLEITSPYSFSTQYDASSFARYDALKTKLTTIDLAPTLAWSPSPMFSIGASLNAEHTSATLTTALPNLSPLLPDGFEDLHGSGWDFGFSVGAQFHPTDRASLGISYKSKINHGIDGTVAISGLLGPLAGSNLTAATSANFKTPWMLIGGFRYGLTDRLTLDAQIQRTGWSEFNAITVNLGPGVVIGENYKDTTSGGVGFDYAVNPRWTVRAGVQYDPTPTPSTRDARVPDGDRWLFGAGTTFKATDSISIDLAASYIAFKDTHVDRTDVAYAGSPAAVTVNTIGDVTANAVVLSAGAHFTF